MRLTVQAWAVALCLSLPSTAEHARVFLSGIRPSALPSTILTPSEARLVIAQRFGLSRYHRLAGADDHTINAINDFSSHSQPLFGDAGELTKSRALVILEDVPSESDVLDELLGAPSFFLERPPQTETNSKFVDDLRSQAEAIYGHSRIIVRPQLESVADSSYRSSDRFCHSQELQTTSTTHGISSQVYQEEFTKQAEHLRQILDNDQDLEMTLIVVPHAETSHSIFKRSSTSSWGQYTRVKRQEPLDGDRIDFVPDTDDFDVVDTIGSVPPPSRPATNMADAIAAASGPTAFQSNETVEPPKGILPVCHRTEDECEDITHGCSGHGSCKLKYGSGLGSCFSCQCTSERIETLPGMFRTIIWAGPACQKKDISVGFWLLFGTTFFILAAFSAGISMLYSMGSQELPSVLGAGVAGVGGRQK